MNRTVRKNSLLFLAGSGLYPLLEVLWRGYSHASMALAGGVCLLLINAVCCEKMKRRSLPARCAIGSLIITVVEFLFGLLVNRVLHLHVWDYSALPLNIMGQICLPFSLIWFVLTIPQAPCASSAAAFPPSRKRQNPPRSSQTLDIFLEHRQNADLIRRLQRHLRERVMSRHVVRFNKERAVFCDRYVPTDVAHLRHLMCRFTANVHHLVPVRNLVALEQAPRTRVALIDDALLVARRARDFAGLEVDRANTCRRH